MNVRKILKAALVEVEVEVITLIAFAMVVADRVKDGRWTCEYDLKKVVESASTWRKKR